MITKMASHTWSMVPDDVKKILSEFAELRLDKNKNKIICCLSGHEMPTNSASVLSSYVNGKKFKKLQRDMVFDYDKYHPHIIPNPKKKFHNELLCTLTLRHIARTPQAVERHVNGRRYRKALARWQECQETGEVFKPFRRRPKMATGECSFEKKFEDIADSAGEESSETDNLSDLYPDADFQCSDDSDDDDDEMDVENGAEMPAINGTDRLANKRKHLDEEEDSDDSEDGSLEENPSTSRQHRAGPSQSKSSKMDWSNSTKKKKGRK